MPAQAAECQRKLPIKYQTETVQSFSSRLPTAGVELWIIVGEISNEIVGLQARLCTIIHTTGPKSIINSINPLQCMLYPYQNLHSSVVIHPRRPQLIFVIDGMCSHGRAGWRTRCVCPDATTNDPDDTRKERPV